MEPTGDFNTRILASNHLPDIYPILQENIIQTFTTGIYQNYPHTHHIVSYRGIENRQKFFFFVYSLLNVTRIIHLPEIATYQNYPLL